MLFEPVPGITLTRPATVSTTKAITRSCSSWLSVGDSPVVPTGTEAVRAGRDLKLDLRAERVVIDFAALERRDHRDRQAGKRFSFGLHQTGASKLHK